MKKMIMAVIPHNLADVVLEGLARAGFTATYAESRGGLMHQSKRHLFIAVEEKQVDDAIDIIKSNFMQQKSLVRNGSEANGKTSIDTNVGGTVIFTWDIDRIETF